MQFTKIPPNYASLGGAIHYTVKDSTSQELDVRIVSLDEQQIVFGAKRFVGVSQATIDVAPCLRSALHYIPSSGGTKLSLADERFLTVALEVRRAGAETPLLAMAPARLFLFTSQPCTIPAMLTAMPRVRLIGEAECDEITLLAPASCHVTITAQGAGDGAAMSLRTTYAGLHFVRLDMREFAGAESVIVDAGVCGRVEYSVTAPPEDAVRLAWRSAAGSIEHYTFPYAVSVEVAADHRRICGSDGRRTYAVTSDRKQRLRSATETPEVLEALAELLTSPQVWIARGDDYTPAEVISESVVVQRQGTMSCLEIEISETTKGRTLWN